MYPNSIILDVSELIIPLRRASSAQHAKAKRKEPYINPLSPLLDDVVDCLKFRKSFYKRLWDLSTETAAGKYDHLQLIPARELCYGVMELGCHMVNQLDELHCYLPDGYLPYSYCAVNHPAFHDVVLTRTEYLPRYALEK